MPIAFFEKIIGHLRATGRRRTCLLWTGVSLVFLVITALHMGVSFTHMGTHVLGNDGDHTAGIMYNTWVNPNRPIPGLTHMTNYPYGEDLWQPLSFSSLVPSTIHLVLSHLSNIVWGWNLLVLIGYMSSALTMFGFMYWWTRNGWVAFFAGYAVTFTPFHVFSSWGHIAGLLSAVFTLALWQFLALWRRPTWLRALGLGATLGVGFYTDGYYILIGLVMLLSFWVAAIGYGLFARGAGFAKPVPQLKALFLSSVVAGVALLPLAWFNFRYASLIQSIFQDARGNIVANAQVYSAQLAMYVTPKTNLFLGFTVIALAIIGVVVLWHQYRKAGKKWLVDAQPQLFTGWVALVLAVLAAWISLRPRSELFGLTIYNPSSIIITLTSSWRVFGRLYTLVVVGVVVLASLGLVALVRKYPTWRHWIVGVSLLLLVVELYTAIPVPKNVSFDYKTTPAVYSWLKGNPTVRAVAEYPLDGSSSIDSLTFQETSAKPMLNTMLPNSAQESLRMSIAGIDDPQTLPVLRALGIDLVNLRTINRNNAMLDLPSVAAANSGLEEVPFGPNGWGIRSFRIKPGPLANYALVMDANQSIENNLNGVGSATYVLGDNPMLAVVQLPNSAAKPAVTIGFDVFADSERGATIVQNGKLLWSGTLRTGGQHIQLNVSPDYPLTIYNERSAQLTRISLSKLQAY